MSSKLRIGKDISNFNLIVSHQELYAFLFQNIIKSLCALYYWLVITDVVFRNTGNHTTNLNNKSNNLKEVIIPTEYAIKIYRI